MIYIIMILSFLLEGIVTNLVNYQSLLIPAFTITSLVIIYPYFNKEKRHHFFIASAILGICYDIVYTNSLFINTFTFALCSLIILLIYNFISHNFINTMLLNIFFIALFRSLSYGLLILFRHMSFDKNIILSGILSSLILNVVYGLILYFVCDRLSYKLNIIKN